MNSIDPSTAAVSLVADPDAYLHHCTCGNPHPAVGVENYIGSNAAELMAADLGRLLGDDGSVMVLDDENTHNAAGEGIEARLRDAGVTHRVLTLPGAVEATESTADMVCREADAHRMILAVGAGTINDLGKFASARRENDYWAFPTAPSMNGYTSAIAAIHVDGVKRTLPAPPPGRIYADPGVICSAPLAMIQAGYCDVMAKSVSDVDWQMEHLLVGGSYCPLPAAMVAEIESAYLDRPEAVAGGDPQAVMALFQGLLLSGVSMSLAGSSAPASGGEHLVSHVLDMREKITGKRPELHGLQVAAGIVVSAACYQRLAALPASQLQGDAEKRYHADVSKISGVWGALAPEIEKRFALKRDVLMTLETRLPARWEAARALCRSVRSPQFYAGLMRRTGFPLTLDALHLDREEFLLAAIAARTIRERLTVLDIAAQAGVLEAAAEDALQLLR